MKYPKIKIDLSKDHSDCSATFLQGAVVGAMMKAKVPGEEIDSYLNATARYEDKEDYLKVSKEWVNVVA